MKRFLLFYGDYYYPLGGWKDFKGSFGTLQDAKDKACVCDWLHIIDMEDGSVVYADRY